MFKNTVTAEQWGAIATMVQPTKPTFSLGKIREKLREFYDAHEEVRLSSDANKELHPRIHQSVQSTAWELIKYYIKHWGKANASNNEIRITHSYLRQALNNSCCIATLKNHINKLLAMSNGFIKYKYRGGLRLKEQNTACIVLVLDQKVLVFKDERHNLAIGMDEVAAEESMRKNAEQAQTRMNAAQQFQISKDHSATEYAKRNRTPASIGDHFKAMMGGVGKRE